MTITFFSQSEENMQKAITEYEKYEGKTFGYYVLSVNMFDSEGNQYTVDGGYNHKPSDEDMRALAEGDWQEYYLGVNDDAETNKDHYIQELLDGYITVEKDVLNKYLAQEKYDKSNTKHFSVKLNRNTDAHLIKHLEQAGNIQGTIKKALEEYFKNL